MSVDAVSSSRPSSIAIKMPSSSVDSCLIRPVWERVVLNVTDKRGKTFIVTDVIHNPTGTLYRDDSLYTVAIKCLILALTTPVFYGLKAIWHGFRIVLDTTVIASRFFYQLANRKSTGQACKEISEKTFQDLSQHLQHNLWRVVRAPFVIISIEAGALLGLISPYQGRRVVGFMEQIYNEDISIKESHCAVDAFLSGNISSWSDLSEAFSKKEVCYLAPCFQSKGSIENQEKFQIISRMPIRLLEDGSYYQQSMSL